MGWMGCPCECWRASRWWRILGDFPGSPVVKNPPSNAGNAALIPHQGTKIPHAMGQLSPPHNYWACAPQRESPSAANYRAHALRTPHTTTREKATCHNKEPVLQWKIPRASMKTLCAMTKTWCSQKNKRKINKLKKKKKMMKNLGIKVSQVTKCSE